MLAKWLREVPRITQKVALAADHTVPRNELHAIGEELALAWKRIGLPEPFAVPLLFLSKGDDGSQDQIIGSFRNFIKKSVGKESFALEIGPSYNPILPKSEGHNVVVLDHDDQTGLVRKYAGQPVVDTSKIEPVDVVWQEGSLVDALGERKFDAVVAAHVIEHAPDFVQFLNDCSSVLHDHGSVFLIVPDRRYCFDYFQPISDPAKIIGDHLQKRNRHSFESFYRMAARVTAADAVAWSQHDLKNVKFSHDDPNDILQLAKQLVVSQEYMDAHENFFTPASFILLVEELNQLHMIDLRIEIVSRSRECEFLAVLKKSRNLPDCPKDVFLKKKMALYSLFMAEELERIEFGRSIA